MTIYIDNKPYEAKPGKNLLEACLELGLNLPYFCWHPALGSVGACRQCAVKVFKDEDDKTGRLVMDAWSPCATISGFRWKTLAQRLSGNRSSAGS